MNILSNFQKNCYWSSYFMWNGARCCFEVEMRETDRKWKTKGQRGAQTVCLKYIHTCKLCQTHSTESTQCYTAKTPHGHTTSQHVTEQPHQVHYGSVSQLSALCPILWLLPKICFPLLKGFTFQSMGVQYFFSNSCLNLIYKLVYNYMQRKVNG